MRRRFFHLTALVSLVLLAMVLMGLFSSIALMRYSTDLSATPPRHRQAVLKLYRGQVEVFVYDFPLGSGAMPALGVRYELIPDGYTMPGAGPSRDSTPVRSFSSAGPRGARATISLSRSGCWVFHL